ncbi:MAG: hypothetical protein JWM33_758 [Caulobacteraceae bacterium]|nr:hypothetical protein [Caulobacteraceae bacterium]
MTENEIARALWLRAARGVGSASPLAKALVAWARPLRTWLTGAAEALIEPQAL